MNKILNPKVSILMAVFNCQKFIEQAVVSILKQTYQNWELILIDDNSKDQTYPIVIKYKEIDPRIKVFRTYKNMGQTYCLNFGLSLCKGEYIARLDGDDLMFPERIEKQVDFLDKHPEIGLLGTAVEIIDEKGNFISIHRVLCNDLELRKALYKINPFFHSSVMIRHKILNDLEYKYNYKYKYAQDYDLWIRISTKSKLANLPDVLTKYRVYGNSISRKLIKSQSLYFIKVQYYSILNKNFPFWALIYMLKPIIYIIIPRFLIKLHLHYRITRDKIKGEYFLK